MKRWSTTWLAAIGIGIALLAATPARAADPIAFVEQHAQWEISYGAVYFRAFGTLQNKSSKPVKYVKLTLDLIDASGKSVYQFVGYNQKAESLGEVEGLGADTTQKLSMEEKLKKIEPLKPGEKDLYRLGVSKDDIPKKPKFKTISVKIVEVK